LPVAPLRGILPLDVAADSTVDVGSIGRATLANAEDRPLHMTLFFAAFGATVAALLESSVVPYLRLGDAQPHLVFIFAVIATVVGGFDRGLVWAFVGGLLLDILTERPLGVSAFALLICVGGVAALGRVLSRARPLLPIVATLLLSLVYSMSLFVTYAALGDTTLRGDALRLFMPSVAYDTVIAALVGPLLISFVDRRAESERVEW
jgi:rod shape-determining protein MreD